MRTVIIAIAASLLAACADHPLRVYVETDTGPAWLFQHDVGERTKQVAEAAAAIWGGTTFENVTIHWVDQVVGHCGAGQDSAHVIGCTETTVGDTFHHDEVHIYVSVWAPCPEATALPHEVGHVSVDKGGHTNPDWCSGDFWNAMIAALDGLTPGDASCAHAIQEWYSESLEQTYCR